MDVHGQAADVTGQTDDVNENMYCNTTSLRHPSPT